MDLNSSRKEGQPTNVNAAQAAQQKKERFQFILSVNGNIICQRYFKMNGFNPLSLYSKELKLTVDEIVDGVMTDQYPGFDPGILNGDLVSKSRVYMWYTYDEDYVEEQYTNPLDEPWSCTFKFAFIVDDKEVISKIWDGTVYPRLVRENVDIVNKKGKYDTLITRMNPYEINLYYTMMADKSDLTYLIINKLCDVCSNTYSNKYDYTLNEDYKVDNSVEEPEKVNYAYDVKFKYAKDMARLENQYAAKTRKYFRNLY